MRHMTFFDDSFCRVNIDACHIKVQEAEQKTFRQTGVFSALYLSDLQSSRFNCCDQKEPKTKSEKCWF